MSHDARSGGAQPRILLGISGGIAAYKGAELTRSLIKAGADVQVVLTARAEAFVTPLTLAVLSGHPVHRDEFPREPGPAIGHIELARWAELILIAPATANVIARLAHGAADDLIATVALVFSGPLVLAPAMNPWMWDHPETRANVARLQRRGVRIVEPEHGLAACGDQGAGRLAALEAITAVALESVVTSHQLAGLDVLVTAGPTHEPLDPARYLGNRSSGAMGFAIAAAARARGARVTLISGPTALAPPYGVAVERVETALELRAAVSAAAPRAALIVMAAAVADHRPAAAAPQKLAHKDQPWALPLVPNPDILAELCAARRPGQVIVGFAAETSDPIGRGTAKRQRKGCDLLLANDVTEAGSGFAVETNRVVLIGPDGPEPWPLLGKREVAERLLDRCGPLLAARAGEVAR